MKDYIDLLKENGQEHLLKYIDMANDANKKKLIEQIKSIDFDQMKNLYQISKRDKNKAIESYIIEHTKFTDKYKIEPSKYKELESIGEEIIKLGQYAVVTMAGGQRNKTRT